jgi:aspartate/methionine/tyrosine aminotransferase
MGIYEVLFAFQDSSGIYLGDPGTHPWAQGFPMTTQLPGGPEIPSSIEFDALDLKYPPATGTTALLEAIRDYYNHFYGADLTTDNIAVFAGGRPALFATLCFLRPELQILIEETEYTPYYDVLKLLDRKFSIIPSHEGNEFRPSLEDYKTAEIDPGASPFVLKSNPCNPTGVTWTGQALEDLVGFCSTEGQGGIIDEAYEFFHSPEPISAMQYVRNIDKTDLFVIGAATKGLQVPGMRTGWAIASKANIEIFRNYSSLGMGGVSRASQLFVAKLLDLQRVTQAREAVSNYFTSQRNKYRQAFTELGMELHTGDGGFYHWGKLPGSLSAREFNERLFKRNAAILPGTLCDMLRRGDDGPYKHLFRFSFGAVKPEDFDESIAIIRDCL